MNGPESFTPDNAFIVGEAPELDNFFVAAGFNSQGVLSGAGIGLAMAEWIVEGHPTMDLSAIDIARFHPFQGNEKYLRTRIRESLGLLYAMHWPHRQMESARPARQTPLHSRTARAQRLLRRNRRLGARELVRPCRYCARLRVQLPTTELVRARRARAPCRSRVGRTLRFVVVRQVPSRGRDAEAELNRICCNDVAVAPGRCVYTGMLNDRGGYEADLTVTRLSAHVYMIVTAAASQNRDFHWIRRSLRPGAHAVLTDVTSAFATLAVMGPASRDLLTRVSAARLDNDAFPFGTCKEIEIGYARALAMRLTYVGELGWELYVPSEHACAVFDLLMEAGQERGLTLAGYHALDSLRSEKGYRHWGHDITPTDTPLEASLAFTVAWSKASDFTGRSALETLRASGVTKRLVFVKLRGRRADVVSR